MKNEEEEFQQDNEGGSFSFKLGSNDGGISLEDWLSVSDEERKGEDSRRHIKSDDIASRMDASTLVDQTTREVSVAYERAILVGVYRPDEGLGGEPLAELAGLAEAARVIPVGELIQRRATPDVAYCLGSGKLEELEELVQMYDAQVVIFDRELAPGQTRNLEKRLQVKVIDRTELILDVFASRARTREARLAVELAQLEYSLPRLKRMWTHLERQTVGGVGLRGPGEKQLEVDRRIAQKRIVELKRELTEIHSRK